MENSEEVLLSKWLSKTISPEELNILHKSYDINELEQILSKQREFDLDTLDSKIIWAKLDIHKVSPQTKWLKRIVFIGLILTCAFFLFNYLKSDKINSSKGQNKIHQFADNSKVTLSPLSSIEFDKSEWNTKRTVSLKGQAFFEVEKGPSFKVLVPQGQIQVLGTKFEIWESGTRLKVSCTDGKVSITNIQNEKVNITRGQSISINNGGFSDISPYEFNTAEFLSNRIKYTSIDVLTLSKEIERFYNIKVAFKNIDSIKKYTGILVLNDKEKAISYIAKTMNWTYEIKEANIIFTLD